MKLSRWDGSKTTKLLKSAINELLTIACNILLKMASVAEKQKLANVMTAF